MDNVTDISKEYAASILGYRWECCTARPFKMSFAQPPRATSATGPDEVSLFFEKSAHLRTRFGSKDGRNIYVVDFFFYLWVLHPVAYLSNWFLMTPLIATKFQYINSL
jgi:hypothetical protein